MDNKHERFFRDKSYKHPIQKSIDSLISSLTSVMSDTKEEKIFMAARDLKTELNEQNRILAIALFPASTNLGLDKANYNKKILKYTENCEDSIYKYQSNLLADASTLEQTKAKISGFIERYTPLKQSNIKFTESKISDTNPDAVQAIGNAKEVIKKTKDNPEDNLLDRDDTSFTPE